MSLQGPKADGNEYWSSEGAPKHRTPVKRSRNGLEVGLQARPREKSQSEIRHVSILDSFTNITSLRALAEIMRDTFSWSLQATRNRRESERVQNCRSNETYQKSYLSVSCREIGRGRTKKTHKVNQLRFGTDPREDLSAFWDRANTRERETFRASRVCSSDIRDSIKSGA
ncbi:hypothetical protein C8R43DRAFT_946933 [Mycena crocata]|nr:hypothetical protein C8R43DRAFT_946933 [Mycena crocata]